MINTLNLIIQYVQYRSLIIHLIRSYDYLSKIDVLIIFIYIISLEGIRQLKWQLLRKILSLLL